MKRLNKALSRMIGERRIYITTGEHTAHTSLTPLRQIGLGIVGAALVGWAAMATIMVASDSFAPRSASTAISLQGVQFNQIEQLQAERARYAAQAEDARIRFERAAAIMTDQQEQIVALQTHMVETSRIAAEQRATLDHRQISLVEREQSLHDALAQVQILASDLLLREGQAHDLGRTVDVLLSGLSRTAEDRNEIAAELAGYATERAELEARAILAEQRQERVIDRLERAVEGSIVELESVFDAAGADLDAMFPTGGNYIGQGGPDLLFNDHDHDHEDIHGTNSGEGNLLELDRVGMLLGRIGDLRDRRDALGQMPFAGPVRSTFRQTSGFGPRRDPINGGYRNHNGLDFAAPVGTPLHATGAGEVVFAGRSGAFGNLVRIQHAFGYETLYAHLSRIRVAVGDIVEAGDRIGDMGSTGRSTGSHLHYEVHRNGRPVDPMTYLKAAEDVL